MGIPAYLILKDETPVGSGRIGNNAWSPMPQTDRWRGATRNAFGSGRSILEEDPVMASFFGAKFFGTSQPSEI